MQTAAHPAAAPDLDKINEKVLGLLQRWETYADVVRPHNGADSWAYRRCIRELREAFGIAVSDDLPF